MNKLRELWVRQANTTGQQYDMACADICDYLWANREELADLIDAAKNYIAAQEVEAKAKRIAEVAEENYSNPEKELDDSCNATIKVMECHRLLCAALAKLEAK